MMKLKVNVRKNGISHTNVSEMDFSTKLNVKQQKAALKGEMLFFEPLTGLISMMLADWLVRRLPLPLVNTQRTTTV